MSRRRSWTRFSQGRAANSYIYNVHTHTPMIDALYGAINILNAQRFSKFYKHISIVCDVGVFGGGGVELKHMVLRQRSQVQQSIAYWGRSDHWGHWSCEKAALSVKPRDVGWRVAGRRLAGQCEWVTGHDGTTSARHSDTLRTICVIYTTNINIKQHRTIHGEILTYTMKDFTVCRTNTRCWWNGRLQHLKNTQFFHKMT